MAKLCDLFQGRACGCSIAMSPIYLLLRQMGEFVKAEIKEAQCSRARQLRFVLQKFCRFCIFQFSLFRLEDCEGFTFYNIGHQMQYYIGVLTSFPQNKHFRQKWKETKHWKSFFQFVLILSFLWLISFYNILIWSKQTAKWWKHLYNQFVILLNISNPGILFWHKITQFRSRAECMEIHKYSESDLHSSSYSNLP